ncbi:hypothetical protein DsansV1_C15g0138241 [Dioscorea sansibarensis]
MPYFPSFVFVLVLARASHILCHQNPSPVTRRLSPAARRLLLTVFVFVRASHISHHRTCHRLADPIASSKGRTLKQPLNDTIIHGGNMRSFTLTSTTTTSTIPKITSIFHKKKKKKKKMKGSVVWDVRRVSGDWFGGVGCETLARRRR